jgi:hypothetical protein
MLPFLLGSSDICTVRIRNPDTAILRDGFVIGLIAGMADVG